QSYCPRGAAARSSTFAFSIAARRLPSPPICCPATGLSSRGGVWRRRMAAPSPSTGNGLLRTDSKSGWRFRRIEMQVGVAIVDDERPARDLLRGYVAAHPSLKVIGEAASGAEALEMVRRVKPSLLLLDIQMPPPDGFGVLESLASRDDGELPSFIFVTAFDHYAVRAFEVNAVDYLLKPVTRERFNLAIDRYLAATD